MADYSQTVRRAIHLLNLIHANDGAMDFAMIHGASGLGRSVCYRLLATLQYEGMIARHPETGRYVVGPKVIELAGSALGHNALRVKANPILRELARKTGDAVLLFIPYGSYAMCVDRMDGDAPVRAAGVDIGGKLPLHTGGAPFTILSHLNAEEQDAILEGILDVPTPKTLTDPEELRRRIETTRRDGYAVGDEDAIDQVVAIGAPIFGPGGRLFGAVSVGGAKSRYRAQRLRSMIPVVLDAAGSISRAIGGSAPETGGHA